MKLWLFFYELLLEMGYVIDSRFYLLLEVLFRFLAFQDKINKWIYLFSERLFWLGLHQYKIITIQSKNDHLASLNINDFFMDLTLEYRSLSLIICSFIIDYWSCLNYLFVSSPDYIPLLANAKAAKFGFPPWFWSEIKG